ncbi:hypothetical protein ACIGXI_20050 [Kitasatospora aureofaciens]|uniref:hypothetical protein n=1 Tax=Kitasatospora aureofaciens TaxID=1894 RepID=UPI0037C5DD62
MSGPPPPPAGPPASSCTPPCATDSDGLCSLTLLALADAGQARREPSWGQPARLSLPRGVQNGLTAALDAAVTDTPDTAPLLTLLRCAGSSTAA